MLLSECYEDYAKSAVCKPRTIRSYGERIRWMIRIIGDIQADELCPELFNKARKNALEKGYSRRTIENSIKNTCYVVGNCNYSPHRGVSLKQVPPNPRIITMKSLNLALGEMPDWLRCYYAFGYLTGLRLNDLRGISLSTSEESLTVRSGKTGKIHRFPVPGWCRRTVKSDCFTQTPKTIYSHTRAACKSANVPYFTPQNIRVLSARTWDKVSRGLGPVILGHSLPGWSSATPYYLDPCEPLFDRIGDFPAPDSLLTVKERCDKQARRERIIRIIDRLDARKQGTLLDVAEGLAG